MRATIQILNSRLSLNSIVVGAVNCQLRAAFTKLAKFHVKQNFACAIVVGNLFGDCSTENELDEISALLNGNINVPLPTYFTIGNLPLPTRIVEKIQADDEVCPNLYFLGKRGTLKTAEGLRIAALGGTFENAESHTKPQSNASGRFQSTYSDADARALFGTHKADILITSQWPKGIRIGSQKTIPEDPSVLPAEVQCVAEVCATLRPRYHFSTSDQFYYEREPFFHMPTEPDGSDGKSLTRFISLASFGSKQKAMYAFSVDVQAAPALTIPAGVTASPLSAPQSKRKGLPPQRESFQRFGHDNSHGHHGPRKRRRELERANPPGPEQCFFCLSNPNVEAYLITSIGNESYLTTAKGPLPPANFFPSLGFPGHMLIIPFEHAPTFGTISDPQTRASTYAEMQHYRTSLQEMVATLGGGKLGALTWEVSRANGIHTHWQFLPVPIDMILGGLVEVAFQVEAENLKYPTLSVTTKEMNGESETGDYFRVTIWCPANAAGKEPADPEEKSLGVPAGGEKTLLLDLTPQFRFDLQFGRRVMAKLLEIDQRMNWRDSLQEAKEEEADAEAFKKAFKAYDFSIEKEDFQEAH